MQQIKESIKIDNDFVILDVDRTIINTTSWYKACVDEDLLISKKNIKEFVKINDKAFIEPTKEKLEKFRLETFNLIEQKIESNYIRKISKIFDKDMYFKEGDYTNSWRFYMSGKYTARKLVKTYDDAIKYIKYISKYYGSNLKVIFLTSGYEPFIRGVVDEIVEKNNLMQLNYSVIGSKVVFEKGKVKETYHISQFEKQKVVEDIIKHGGKIRFLADDSNENEELFKTVENDGGVALRIKHIPNQSENETWKEFVNQITKDNLKESLKNKDSNIKVSRRKLLIPTFLGDLSKNTNKIGITSMCKSDYLLALKRVNQMMHNQKNIEKFNECIESMVFKKGDSVYLRGKLYYNWLPQYIFSDTSSINNRWKQLMNTCIKALDIVNEENILKFPLNYLEQVIIYIIIDHVLEGILYILNLIEQNSLIGNSWYEKEQEKVINITQDISDLLYAHIYEDSRRLELINKVILELKKLELINNLPSYTKIYKSMRELDDNIIIFRFVQSIVKEMKEKNINIDYIISFPYGGIALGFAIKSYIKIGLNEENSLKILNSHFSSKQRIREKRTENDIDFSIFKYIPNIYSDYKKKIERGENNILLLDNNVTTFKTLDLCKNFLGQLGNKVYASVPAVNYDNIVDFLLDKKCEMLVSDWRRVLDFHPIEEYITAFNTWNTSNKSKILQKVYYMEEANNKIEFLNVKEETKKYIFKICRVQNVQDLNTVVQNGANMIGIHAVYPDRIKYLKNELKYMPIVNNLDIKEDLPVGVLELGSIRDMQRFIPTFVKQAILFESPLSIEEMIETCDLYNIPKSNMYIQLQHRVDNEYIKEIKEKICKNLIVTIGLFQKDFEEYFWKIHNMLDATTDYILIDLSKHQPDLISCSENYKESVNRISVLNHLTKTMKNNKIPIILADDTTTEQMEKYLKIMYNHNIKIKGIDMQNVVELKTNEQRYQKMECEGRVYQGKIRKSATKMAEWKEFLDKIDENIFVEG